MKILGNRVLVSKIEEEKKEGFQTVEVQDNFINKGKIEKFGVEFDPNNNRIGTIGDVIIFAKYSPDTQEIEHKGKRMKIINVDDILAIL